MNDNDGRGYLRDVGQILVLFVVYLVALTVGSSYVWTRKTLSRLRAGTETAVGRLPPKRQKS
ncbi:hypothetical protein [Halobellus clavatus]|jgi:hypothetical protein|uniref:Uncharacterized protein n=1 Tax=Halobellus clavatus TaxID=660517 RepID=A0A1H3FRT5_9EURY|nr:hypothetical protein [Halobellus clavatus]SDX92874.1 hypothetical protein SAMN04487946_10496 [Halobellus clavatus]